MSTKHAVLDRKLFQWVRETRTDLTVPGAIATLRVHDKGERRHITRRFMQMRARNMLRMTHKGPIETFETCGFIPYDTTRSEWINACQGRRRVQDAPRVTGSIRALTSEEFLRAGGEIEYLDPPKSVPHYGSRPTGHGFSFDD